MPRPMPDPILDAIQRYLDIWTKESTLAEVEDANSSAWRNPSQITRLQARAEVLSEELGHAEEPLSETKPTNAG